MDKQVITVYLHGSKEDNYCKGEELGLEGEALRNFSYCCYEVALEVEVDMKTGKTKILGVKK